MTLIGNIKIIEEIMFLRTKNLLWYGIALHFLFTVMIADIERKPIEDISFAEDVHYMEAIYGYRWAIWFADGNLCVYSMSNEQFLFNITMTTASRITVLKPQLIKVSPDLTTLVAIHNRQICWVTFGLTLIGTTVTCQQNDQNISNIIRNYDAASFQFLQDARMILVTAITANNFVIANLSKPSPRGLSFSIPDQIVATYRWEAKKKILFLLRLGEIVQISFDATNSNYSVIVNKGMFQYGKEILAFERNGVQCVLIMNGSTSNPVYYLSNNSLLGFNFNYQTHDFMELQGNIIFTTHNHQAGQLQISTLTQLGPKEPVIDDKIIVRKPIFKNQQTLLFVFKKQGDPTVQCLNIVGFNLCQKKFPNCNTCDLLFTVCIQCNAGFSISLVSLKTTCTNILNFTDPAPFPVPVPAPDPDPVPTTQPQNNSNQVQGCNSLNCQKCLDGSAQICIKCSNSYMLTSQGFCQYSSITDIFAQVADTATYPLSFPSIKTIAKTSILLFLFLDDYWYYIYHDVVYKKQMQWVFNLIKQTNQASLVPQFIDLNIVQEAISPNHFMTSNYSRFTPTKIIQIDEQNIQFLRRGHEIYAYNFSLSLVLFIIVKIITKFMKKRQDLSHQSLMYKIVTFFTEFSYLKTLIVSILEASIIFISFSCTLQFFQPSSFMFLDRLSLIVGHMFFFFTLIYSICFYPMVFALETKQETQIYLNYSKYSFKGILNQTMLVSLRNIANGFIHAYLIYHYQAQIYLLIAVKIVVIAVMLKFRNQFQHKLVLVILEAYFSLGVFLDLYFVLDYTIDFNIEATGLIQAIAILLIFMCTAFLCIYLSGYAIWEFAKQFFCKNKISPLNQQKVKPVEKQNDKQSNKKSEIQTISQSQDTYIKHMQYMKRDRQRQNIFQLADFDSNSKNATPKKFQKQNNNVFIITIQGNQMTHQVYKQSYQNKKRQPAYSYEQKLSKNLKKNHKQLKQQKNEHKQINRNLKRIKTNQNFKKEKQKKANNGLLLVRFDPNINKYVQEQF